MNFARVEKPQEERLHARAHLADFIEEQRPAVRETQNTGAVAVRAGKAAAHMTEELRFEERIWHSSAIDGDETSAASTTLSVNAARDDLFADAAFTRNEDFRVRLGCSADVASDSGDNGA
jgi:hypothetical protein